MDVATDTSPKKVRPKRGQPTPEQEACWNAYRDEPSCDNRNALVECYGYLVTSMVRRFSVRLPRTVDRGDLQTAGSVGLMGAVTSFDPSRMVTFEAYADMRIRGALLDELRVEDWLPRPWRKRIETQKRAIESLRAELGREPRDSEVAERLDLSEGEYELLFGTGFPGGPTGSMPGADDEGDVTAGLEVVPDPRSAQPSEKLTRDELLRLVAQRLTDQEYRIVYLKYWEELSMREIGQLTGLSESRVCKIHSKLLDRLKDRFRVGVE